MKKFIVVMSMFVLAGSLGFAQSSGESVYKAKCENCHGSNGTPPPGIAKAMNVRSASDPSVKSKSEALMLELTKRGSGKMPAYAGKLTDDQIKASVEYYRSLGK